MNRLIRFYNQNRWEFWFLVLVIAGIILLIHIIDGIIKDENTIKASQSNNIVVTSNEERIKNTKASNPVIDGNVLTTEQTDINKNIIEMFFQYCKKGEYIKAYNLLSINCKDLYFKTAEEFKENYVDKKITKNSNYDYELWDSYAISIYRIKIYEDMLSTGKISNSYNEDFYTIINENNQTKLNINGFINRINKNKYITKNNITIKVNYVDIYKDTFVYNVTITNNSTKNIILDTRTNTNTTYIKDNKSVRIPALLYENFEKDLKCDAKQEKTLNIKFNISYRGDLVINDFVFSNVLLDENDLQNSEEFNIKL